MGYKMPIVCKKIVLPIELGDSLSLEQYKEKYGIDLKNFIKLQSTGKIDLIAPDNTELILTDVGTDSPNYFGLFTGPITGLSQSAYIAGEQTGNTTISRIDIDMNVGFGINIFVDQADDFILDNVFVDYYEI